VTPFLSIPDQRGCRPVQLGAWGGVEGGRVSYVKSDNGVGYSHLRRAIHTAPLRVGGALLPAYLAKASAVRAPHQTPADLPELAPWNGAPSAEQNLFGKCSVLKTTRGDAAGGLPLPGAAWKTRVALGSWGTCVKPRNPSPCRTTVLEYFFCTRSRWAAETPKIWVKQYTLW